MSIEVMSSETQRADFVRRGRWLEYFTIGYNSLEGLIAVVAGLAAGSIALVGFGFDSLIEVTSGAVLLWRLHADVDEERREQVETISLRIVGVCFMVLAIYVSYDSLKSLIRREAPEESLVGIVLAAVSLVVMPLLIRAKRKVALAINSGALMADSKQTELCTYLSAILLGGLLLNALFSWWWADPVAALVMVPIIVKRALKPCAVRLAATKELLIDAESAERPQMEEQVRYAEEVMGCETESKRREEIEHQVKEMKAL